MFIKKIKIFLTRYPTLKGYLKLLWLLFSVDLPILLFPKFGQGKKVSRFLKLKVQDKTVLIVEAQNCHGEVIPGFVSWFRKYDFDVDLLVTQDNFDLNPLSRIHDNKVRIFSFDTYVMQWILRDVNLKKYKHIIFTSRTLYSSPPKAPKLIWPTIFQYYPTLNAFRDKIISVEHHIERIRNASCCDSFMILANPAREVALKKKVVNLATFGKIHKTSKHNCSTFIVVGNIQKTRKNFDLLISSFQKLKHETDNFKVIIVARNGELKIPSDLEKHFSFYQNISFEDLYSLIERSDFILALLDPEIEAHKRYLINGTSGTFQLVYGFTKPCILQEEFARCYGFNNNNSITYMNNSELPKAILKAINMDSISYSQMQEHLEKLTLSILESSCDNFKRMLNNSSEHSLR